MILETIRIENFRSFKDQTVAFDRYTCLVGPNGAGKSTVLTALNVFFRNTASAATNMVTLGREDFHDCETSNPITITLTFKDLSAEAKTDLKHYVRHEQLVVSAKALWNDASKSAEVKQFGSRLVMKEFAPYFEAVEAKEKADRLAEIYETLKAKFPDLPKATSGPARITALNAFEEAHPELCELLQDSAQFFGFTKGSNLLTKYVQWVYIPAVKDASSEQDETAKTALGQLLERTIRTKVDFKSPIAVMKSELEAKYKELVEKEAGALFSLEQSIEKRLHQWANPGAKLKLNWHYDPNKSCVVTEPIARATMGEGNFLGEVARLGHGLQRSFLVSILHELASTVVEGGPTLILGFEEPELYQHPPQAQHMASELEELSTAKHNSQVVLSTHSPYFIATKGIEHVRMVRKCHKTNASTVASTSFTKITAILQSAKKKQMINPSITMMKMIQVMQPSQRELYFSRVAVLVEGLEDVAFIAAHLHMADKWSTFRRLGCHFIIAGGKQNLDRLIAIANELSIPAFVVFDADGGGNGPHIKEENSVLFRLCGLAGFDAEPTVIVWGDNHAVWPVCLGDTIRDEFTDPVWKAHEVKICTATGYQAKEKNHLLITEIMESLAADGKKSPTLDKLCDSIFAFASPPPIKDVADVAATAS